VKGIEPPDSHHLSAAVGWLELGNALEAELEINRVGSKWAKHRDVLQVRWSIHAAQENWLACVEAARDLTNVTPKEAFGWIHLSFALHELKRTQEAYDNLKSGLEKFPRDWLMHYNLACYSCQMGRTEEAQRWLASAVLQNGNEKEVRGMAEQDPDLAPLFKK
jgi:Flp pilus assembly protein TadD